MIVTACEALGFSPRTVQHAPQISSTINLVASSLGVTIVPACMRHARIDDVRYVPLKETDLRATLGIAYRSGPLAPAVKANLLAMVPTTPYSESGFDRTPKPPEKRRRPR